MAMDMTNPVLEEVSQPKCPNCNSVVVAKNFGSPSEGDYVVYFCQTCADYWDSEADGLVYQPVWE